MSGVCVCVCVCVCERERALTIRGQPHVLAQTVHQQPIIPSQKSQANATSKTSCPSLHEQDSRIGVHSHYQHTVISCEVVHEFSLHCLQKILSIELHNSVIIIVFCMGPKFLRCKFFLSFS